MNRLNHFVAYPFNWLGERLARSMLGGFEPGPYAPSSPEEDLSLFSREMRDYICGIQSKAIYLFRDLDPANRQDHWKG